MRLVPRLGGGAVCPQQYVPDAGLRLPDTGRPATRAAVLVVKPPPPDVQLVHDAKLASVQPLDLSQQYEPERILSGLAPSTKVGWRHDIAGAAAGSGVPNSRSHRPPVYVMRSGTTGSFGTVAKFSPRGVASAWTASSGLS